MHRRTAPHHISAMEFLKSGKVGKIGSIKAFVNYPWLPKSTPDAPVPEGLDWDFFCGPSKLLPFNPRMHPSGYRNFSEFSNGQISDWGTHWLDQVLWWSKEDQHPTAICSIGGRRIFDDNTTIPDSMQVVYKFETFDLTWENRNYAGNPQERHNVGLYFYGSEGVLHLGWLDGWSFYPRGDFKVEPTEHVDSVLDMPDHQNIANLWDDFIKSIEANRLPICDIEVGHRATSLALLAILSLKLGRGIVWDGKKQTIPNDPEACKLLTRDYRSPWKYPTM
jgi:predicted dehydrogenase